MQKSYLFYWWSAAAGLMLTASASLCAQTADLTDEERFAAQGYVSDEASAASKDGFERNPDWSSADIDRYEPFALAESRPSSARATYSVGPGPNCDFANLNAALNVAGDGDVINLTDGNGYAGLTYQIFNRPGTLTIRGGFSDCSQPVPDSGRTILNANGAGSGVLHRNCQQLLR